LDNPGLKNEQLSSRELEIAEGFSSGESYNQIAERLCIAPSTVRTHLTTIYRKLGVTSKLALHQYFEKRLKQPSQKQCDILIPPDKPSIAVMPFDNMSGDLEQEYFADGMAEDIITALSHSPWLFIIARNSTFTYKGIKVDAKQVANELGVKYLLEGSVRKAGNRIRVTAQLIDGTSGGHVWSEQYDRVLADIFDLQDEITQNVVASIQTQVHLTSSDPVWRNKQPNLTVWELTMRAWKLLYDFTPESYITAKALLEKAINLDPESAPAYSVLSLIYHHEAFMGFANDTQKNSN
jgi:adenylate cyclase